MKTILHFTAIALIAIALSGCAKNKKGGAGGSGVDGDYVNGTPLPDRQEGVSFLGSNVDRNKFAPVYFGFDSISVSGEERGKIDQVAQFMQSNGNSVIIAGFTDERGTPEYNRGLGERRAQAVREALIRAGADAGKIQTVSFGAESRRSRLRRKRLGKESPRGIRRGALRPQLPSPNHSRILRA